MSLQRLRNILRATYTVNLDSSAKTIQAVQKKVQARNDKLNDKGKPSAISKGSVSVNAILQQGTLQIRAIDLLRKIGELTTPAWVNMATLSASWATRRYFWAIAEANRVAARLRLNDDVQEMDFHQKTLLSDEFGVGMAGLVLERIFQADQAVDVSVALRDTRRFQNMSATSNSQPDYLMWNVDPTSPYFVVECKGSQTSRATTMDQIRRGLEQVPTLVFGRGARTVTTLVVATSMQKNGTTVYVIDPPDDDDSEREFDSNSGSLPERINERAWKIPDPERFEQRTWNLRLAQMLNWCGQFKSALFRLPEEDLHLYRLDRNPVDRPLTRRELDGIPYAGQSLPLFPELDTGGIRLFMGIREDLLESARKDSHAALASARRFEHLRPGEAARENALPSRSVSGSGLCMEVENLF
jgi:hypothetical protein